MIRPLDSHFSTAIEGWARDIPLREMRRYFDLSHQELHDWFDALITRTEWDSGEADAGLDD